MSEQDKNRISFDQLTAQPEVFAPTLPEADSIKADVTAGITQYLAGFEQDRALKMRALRELLNDFEPDMTEGISWGMPTFKYKGSNVFSFAAAKNHLSIYPGSEAIAALCVVQEGYVCTKGSVHLSWDEPLPESLIRQILRLNIDRVNEAKG